MFVVAPKYVERDMPLFIALFQVIIAMDSFFGGQIVDQRSSAKLVALATVLVLGHNVSNNLVAQVG